VIARALALRPKFIVADEPVSSLDVSVKAQILNLLGELKNQFGLSYLFITHELAVVRSIAERVAVMYLGKIVELGEVKELFSNPLHPYTNALLASTPIPNPKLTPKRVILMGDLPSPFDLPSGCRFQTRCHYKQPKCKRIEPELLQVGKGHYVACHYENLTLEV
jgi:oligopeptide/dipeptide ABC transporter ATP-binding protein